MRRFYFHLIEGGDPIVDLEGMLLPDEQAAIVEATRNVRGIVAHEVCEVGMVSLDRAIEILADDGTFRWRLAFGDAVSIVI